MRAVTITTKAVQVIAKKIVVIDIFIEFDKLKDKTNKKTTVETL